MEIEKLLEYLGCKKTFINGISTWQFPGLSCPNSIDEIKEIARIPHDMSSRFAREHSKFLETYRMFSAEDKLQLKNWIHKNFLDIAWADKNHRHLRVEYAWNKFLKHLDSHDRKFLDIGPGHGFHGILLYKEQYKMQSELFACDIMPCYNQLIQLCGVETQFYDASRMKLNEVYSYQRFDTILCAEVLEHVSDAAENNIISGLFEITNKGGSVMFTFPERAMTEPYNFDRDPMGHVRQPTIAQVSDRLREAGFEIAGTDKFSSGKQFQLVVVAKKK